MSAQYLTDDVDPARVRALIGELIYPSVTLPFQVFQKPYRLFCFYDYSHLGAADCWKTLLGYPPGGDLDVFYLQPDFVAIHEAPGGHPLGIIKIDHGTTLEEIKALISRSPSGHLVDAFVHLGPKCLLVPTSRQWVMWADRAYDIAIVAFRDSDTQDEFIRATPNWITMRTVAEALRFLAGPGSLLDERFFCEPMGQNYQQYPLTCPAFCGPADS